MTMVLETATPVDSDELARAQIARRDRIMRWLIPALAVVASIGAWALYVWAYDIPHYQLPSPARVANQLLVDWQMLGVALWVTLKITAMALGVAVLGGVGLAILFNQSSTAERIFLPYAVILQVTPLIALAPLIFLYVEAPLARVLICAWIVAFFPILSNTTLGLKSTDHNLTDLFQIYRASRWQRLIHLQLPWALPYFLGGLRIAGGLSLVGAIVAEYVVGISGTSSGLAFRILEASYRLNVPRMFAAMILVAVVGVLIYAATSALSWALLHKWHESAIRRER
ncbi:ABC transporter permease [Neogemmobacter tilapiae]|uniref:ABC transporter ATP-binding protein n=1 Tax=Neogemmobacter tilapiae TaxID=875041 RepID=A0A918TJ49_9RHOB|nr:ABC transporter permease [Gemmobacter tilapiae]GHC48100.1 ABC transporter ATP-binding protein [Gemmobacter tilapiae]